MGLSHLAKSRKSLAVSALTVMAMLLSLSYLMAGDDPKCIPAVGRLTDHVTDFATLASEGTVTGDLKGTYNFIISHPPIATPDQPQISFFTANSSILTKTGRIDINETGVVDFTTGNLADLWTVVGGTGRWDHATGQIFANGNFNLAAGTASVIFAGQVCRP